MLEWIASPEAWITLVTLTALEFILGVDNIIFIALLVNKLPEEQRTKARIFGLSLAMLTRIALLASLFWIIKLTYPLIILGSLSITGRDLILIPGGLFLAYKSIIELYEHIQQNHHEKKNSNFKGSFFSTLIQIALLDIAFSFDSVITAIGIAENLEIMIVAIIGSIGVMMFASKGISEFVDAYPSIKILALVFLLAIGIILVLDGLSIHISKTYIYSAMGFSLIVELLNIYANKKNGGTN